MYMHIYIYTYLYIYIYVGMLVGGRKGGGGRWAVSLGVLVFGFRSVSDVGSPMSLQCKQRFSYSRLQKVGVWGSLEKT